MAHTYLKNNFKMNNIQEIREKAAAFLDEIRTGVAEIIKQPGRGFDFREYVSVWDVEHKCGTVCCMEGFVPSIRPDLAIWSFKGSVLSKGIAGRPYCAFYPDNHDIPVSGVLWEALTIAGHQEDLQTEILSPDAPFEQVAALWERTAARIRAGELDHLLIIES